MFRRIEDTLVERLCAGTYWGPPYALARTLLALATAATLILNEPHVLFRLGGGSSVAAACDRVSRWGAFCVVDDLAWARWLAVAVLMLVATGWRPRFTGVLHWWVTVSLQVGATLVDGGDSVASILTLLLIPLTLTDPRRNHWDAMPPYAERPNPHARVVAATATGLISLQVCVIYAHASIGKFAVPQWSSGTALYYWMEFGAFAAPRWAAPLVQPIVRWAPSVTALTWAVLVLEFVLGASLLMSPRVRRSLFAAGVAMHLGILFLQGIASFATVMLAALLLGVWPHRERLPLESVARRGFAHVHRVLRRFSRSAQEPLSAGTQGEQR